MKIPPPISPNFAKQPSVGNVLARTSSSGSTSSHPSLGSANSQRQSSQSSLFEQFASQAKELVKETTRQSSQDGLLAHVDKVRAENPSNIDLINLMLLWNKTFLYVSDKRTGETFGRRGSKDFSSSRAGSFNQRVSFLTFHETSL